jgi:predicted phage terminase large subunit-like protein
LSRLDDNVNGAIIIVTQRLNSEDLCGVVLKHPGIWTVLSLSLIAQHDEQIQIGENLYHFRRAGDLLHPAWFPQSAVDELRSQLDDALFAAQFQQSPIQPAGIRIKRDHIQRYDQLPIRTKSRYVIQSWDTAIKTAGHNDYSVCVTVLVDERNNYYVVDVLRGRFIYPELKAQVFCQAQKHLADTILIEAAGGGQRLVNELKAKGRSVVGIVPEGDKLERLSLQLEKFYNGQVFFPTEAPWLPELETEVLAAPNGPHDDQVDALIQALAYQRPTYWSDDSLKGLEKLNTGLWLSQMWGF